LGLTLRHNRELRFFSVRCSKNAANKRSALVENTKTAAVAAYDFRQ